LGLLLAGTLRAEATLVVANGIYLLLLAVGGVVIPASRLPGALATLVSLLPSAALGQGLRDVLLDGQAFPAGPAVVLVVWAVVGGVLTSRTFRWS
jgi:ABC-2 type transport system permease protein